MALTLCYPATKHFHPISLPLSLTTFFTILDYSTILGQNALSDAHLDPFSFVVFLERIRK